MFDIFLKTVKELNKNGIEPIIYGSFGLSLIIGEFGKINDIDFILSDEDFNKSKLPENPLVSFIKISDVKIIDIDKNNLDKKEMDWAIFCNLKPEQYLEFYEKLSQKEGRGENPDAQKGRGSDHKRRKKEKDLEKIKLIKEFLDKNK